MVKVVVASAKSGGTSVKRPWLGAKLQAVTPDIAESLGLKRPRARWSRPSRRKARPRARAEDRRPDRRDRRADVDDQNAFDYRFATKALGGTAQIGVVRGGKEMKLPSRWRPRRRRRATNS
jgi:S1-C subfamily serine protease